MNECISASISVGWVLIKALPPLFLGLFLGNFMLISQFSAKAHKLLPLVERMTGLPPIVVLVIVLSVADRTAGMSALEAARKQNDLTDRQVVAVNLIAKAPSVSQFFLFSFIPLMFSLFPYTAAVGFLSGYFLAFVAISLMGLALLKTNPLHGGQTKSIGENVSTWQSSIVAAFRQTLGTFMRIALWMFFMSVLVTLVVKSEKFSVLSDVVSLSGGLIGANAIPIVGVGLISMIGGVAAVGTAWQEGLIEAGSIVPLLFLLSIVHNIYDLFSSSIPRTIAIYGRDLGFKIGIIGFVVTEAVMIVFFILALQGAF